MLSSCERLCQTQQHTFSTKYQIALTTGSETSMRLLHANNKADLRVRSALMFACSRRMLLQSQDSSEHPRLLKLIAFAWSCRAGT